MLKQINIYNNCYTTDKLLNRKAVKMDDFRKKTLNTFVAMRDDMDQFKGSMNDWILFLNHEIRDAKMRAKELQKRLEELEMERRLRF